MVRRNARSRKRGRRAEGTRPKSVARPADQGSPPSSQGKPSSDRVRIRPWREQAGSLLTKLRDWARLHHGPALEDLATSIPHGKAQAVRQDDVDRAIDDFICARGSAGSGTSIVREFSVKEASLSDVERAQLHRWESERRRGVFILQRATRDAIELWDPLEGAPITIHMLVRLGAARSKGLPRGTVIVTTYTPWVARLMAVSDVESFPAAEGLPFFRQQVEQEGALWHDIPAAVPVPSAGTKRTKSKGSRKSSRAK